MSTKLIEELTNTIEQLLNNDISRSDAFEMINVARIYLKYSATETNFPSVIRTVPYINGPDSSFGM